MSHPTVHVGRGSSQSRPPARCDSPGRTTRQAAGHRRPHRAPAPQPHEVTFVDRMPPTPIFTACAGDYLIGSRLLARDGRVIGTVNAWAPYPAVLGAPWGVAIVQRGPARSTRYLVDLSGALFDGTDVAVAHDAPTVLSAPRLKASSYDLTLAQRHQVHAYYRGSTRPCSPDS